MEDVDRLFECFKCGTSPPQSAVRERKRSKNNSKRDSSTIEGPLVSGSLSKLHAGQAQKSATESCSTSGKPNSLNCGKQFSPIVFYGSPHGAPPKRSSRLLRLLHEIRLDLTEQSKLNSRELWATFPRQDEAMKFAKELAHVHVFCYQDHLNGQRRFLVSTYKEFWRRYKNMKPEFRHHYEVIQEGCPCHLYFDLEFNKIDNPEKNGHEMVDLLISVILEALFEKYSIQGNKDWIVELDSSTAEKFSRHLIIHLPKTSFKDNIHAGAFVAEVCSRIINLRERNRRYEVLFVKKDSSCDESACQLFVDTAVYSRNRCFRLALSSKAGKSSVLLPTKRFKCKDMEEEDMFMASLICNLDVDCGTLLMCKMDLYFFKTLHFDSEVNGNYQQQANALENFPLNDCTSDYPRSYFMGKSPFPDLDVFVESITSIGNVSGKIRSWYWFSEYGLMVYSMLRNRYCERIGRQHKSNHVMYVFDLQRAVYYQKCHDPDCRGYRSPLRPIPVDAIQTCTAFYSLEPNEGSIHNENHYVEQNFVYNESIISSGNNNSWWVKAIKVVEDVENTQRMQNLSGEEKIGKEEEEDDGDWWMAVERTAAETELVYSEQ